MALEGFSARSAAREPIADINTTPLVDVMLVLLVMFIVTAPLLGASIPLDLPSARGTSVTSARERVVVSVTADGSILWNGEPVGDEAFDGQLKKVAAAAERPQLLVNADRGVRYERVAQVIGFARAAGIQQVGLLATPGPSE